MGVEINITVTSASEEGTTDNDNQNGYNKGRRFQDHRQNNHYASEAITAERHHKTHLLMWHHW